MSTTIHELFLHFMIFYPSKHVTHVFIMIESKEDDFLWTLVKPNPVNHFVKLFLLTHDEMLFVQRISCKKTQKTSVHWWSTSYRHDIRVHLMELKCNASVVEFHRCPSSEYKDIGTHTSSLSMESRTNVTLIPSLVIHTSGLPWRMLGDALEAASMKDITKRLVGLDDLLEKQHGHWPKFQKLHIYSLCTPGGSKLQRFPRYHCNFDRLRDASNSDIFKSAIFGHETWPLAKVPEVAHMPFYLRGSKLSLYSLYGQRFMRYSRFSKLKYLGIKLGKWP